MVPPVMAKTYWNSKNMTDMDPVVWGKPTIIILI